jgi:hypothetical protein
LELVVVVELVVVIALLLLAVITVVLGIFPDPGGFCLACLEVRRSADSGNLTRRIFLCQIKILQIGKIFFIFGMVCGPPDFFIFGMVCGPPDFFIFGMVCGPPAKPGADWENHTENKIKKF